jgi:type I restriction enzyme S subunit
VKAGWQNATIADACDVVNGGTPKTGVAAYWNGKHMWITPPKWAAEAIHMSEKRRDN